MLSPDLLQSILFSTAAGGYFLAFIILLLRLGGIDGRGFRIAYRVITGSTLVIHLLAILARIQASGHLPVVKNYENALTGSFVCMLVFLIYQEYAPSHWKAGLFVFPFTQFLVLFGILFMVPAEFLAPIYRSNWLVIHIFFAWLSFALYALAAGLALSRLLDQRKSPDPQLQASLHTLNRRIIRLGFLFQAVMIFSGSVWANNLWGSYWRWDAVETVTLFSWLVYGLYIHLDLRRRLRPDYCAIYLLVALALVVVSFFGISFFNESYHSFETMGEILR